MIITWPITRERYTQVLKKMKRNYTTVKHLEEENKQLQDALDKSNIYLEDALTEIKELQDQLDMYKKGYMLGC